MIKLVLMIKFVIFSIMIFLSTLNLQKAQFMIMKLSLLLEKILNLQTLRTKLSS